MKRRISMTLLTIMVAGFGLTAPAFADSYSSVTTSTANPLTSETRTTTIESTPTEVIHETPVIQETPVVVTPQSTEQKTTVIKDKRSHHHLLKLPFISIF